MKKLALVTLLAVAASWLLHESRSGGPRPLSSETRVDRVAWREDAPRPPMPPGPPSPPGSIRTVPWRQSDAARPVRSAPDRPTPPWFPGSEAEEETLARPDASGYRVLVGRLSISRERARDDLRKTLEGEVARWMAGDVPPSWKLPAPAINAMGREFHIQQVTRDLKPSAGDALPEADPASTVDVPGLDGLHTFFRAGQRFDFSPTQKARIVALYHRDLAAQRMQRLGGALALALAGLVVLTGYIRADEATRGYYTNRLRLAAFAGLGAAGVAAYRILS